VFRGIVEGTGRVASRAKAALGERLELELPAIAGELVLGQSVAINGACLTVAAVTLGRVAFDLAGETLRCTNLGTLVPGDVVNWERAMRLEDRLDGHLVQGHVDGRGSVRSFDRRGDDRWLEIEAPAELLSQMVRKGSVALDGISLTIAKLGADHLACTIVPHTLAVTNLAARRAGDRVNVECDVLIKWLAQLHERSRPAG
jgi:riboflavin synthase alpha subunit